MITDRPSGLVVRVSGYRFRAVGFDSRRYQIFWEVVGLVRGSLNLVSSTEELPERKISDLCLEDREYSRRDSLRWTRDTLYPQKLVLTSLRSGCRSVGIIRSRTKATEFVLFVYTYDYCLGSNHVHFGRQAPTILKEVFPPSCTLKMEVGR
jgi:hypothetical protein